MVFKKGEIMKIHDVAIQVGLTMKSIRYYEEEGLLTPKRSHNDYREYNEDDINTLKQIKFLRDLGVSILDIKKLKKGELSLKACMEERIKYILEQEKNYEAVKAICIEIANSDKSLDSLDLKEYYQVVNVLEKRGFMVNKIKKSHREKIMGAVISSLIFSALFIFLGGLIFYFQVVSSDKMPWILFAFFEVILEVPVVGILINLIKRIKEILGGEEDEASKY